MVGAEVLSLPPSTTPPLQRIDNFFSSTFSARPEHLTGSSCPAFPTAEVPTSSKHPRESEATESVISPALANPLSMWLLDLMQSFPSSPRISRICEYNPVGLLRKDAEAVMGVLKRLSAWFSDLETAAYLSNNIGITKKIGHRYALLSSSIDSLGSSRMEQATSYVPALLLPAGIPEPSLPAPTRPLILPLPQRTTIFSC